VIGTPADPAARAIPASTHGRYLVRPAPARPRGLLVGLHGYAENADIQFGRLAGIPGAEAWTLVSIQGLHRFYRRDAIAASWMTREDRELAIADNVAYVGTVLAAVRSEWPDPGALVLVGFSQGVAMAFRAACAGAGADAVVALGGDVPPELAPEALRRIRNVFLARGDADPWYSDRQFAADQVRLRDAGADLTSYTFEGDHAWTPAFSEAVGHFLHRLGRPGH